ncbi:MAG: acetolactate synthase large subunit [Candidatus Omnitrophota bacterium]|nr:acetolactate synthase large subunit [Candidatus Omnitrophota bacterium]
MNAAELFIKCLEAEGVKAIFGVPGEENADFVMALDKSPIQLILTRHEQGAAFMAEVHGRLTGEAGVCLGTLGPGAANLVTGVADANMDHSPVIVITGQADSERMHKESHQNMDVVSMFKPITKWAHTIYHPNNVPEVVRKAFKLATTEKPGACHIELPEDIAAMKTTGQPLVPKRVRRPVPADKIVDQAWEAIKTAKRPIILAGNGTIRKRASKQLRLLAEKTGIGVASTFMGKGCVDRDSDQCLFTIGLQAKDLVTCVVDAADLVITVGYDMVEYHPSLWNPKGDKKIVHIDFLPAEVDDHYPVDVEVVGDLAHTLWMLNERVDKDGSPSYDLNHQHSARQQMLEDFEQYKDDDTEGTIRPQKVLWDVRRALGPRDILLSDVGAHKMWIARYYQCNEPNTCLIPNGFCSMGFALPGAIAAKMACPDRNILAICGDGGFMMNVQEMETAKRTNQDIVVMIWEDKKYGLIEWKQQGHFGKHIDLSFENPDFVKLADAFGWGGMRVDNSRDLAGALEAALKQSGPTLISIPIDYRENYLLSKRLGQIACPI